MKITLLFCLLAVYGAVAQGASVDADVNVNVNVDTDAVSDAASDAKATASSHLDSALNIAQNFAENYGPGTMLDSTASFVEGVMGVKNQVVNGSLGMVQDAVDLGIKAAEHGISGGKEMLHIGVETAANIKSDATEKAQSMLSKGLGIANSLTGGHGSEIFDEINSAASAGIKAGDKAADWGLNLAHKVGSWKMDVGKSIVGKIGSGISGGLDIVGKADKAINDNIAGGFRAGAGGAAFLGQKGGGIFSAAWGK